MFDSLTAQLDKSYLLSSFIQSNVWDINKAGALACFIHDDWNKYQKLYAWRVNNWEYWCDSVRAQSGLSQGSVRAAVRAQSGLSFCNIFANLIELRIIMIKKISFYCHNLRIALKTKTWLSPDCSPDWALTEPWLCPDWKRQSHNLP